jgi:zinc/manganese transport system permease protein
MLSLGVIIVSHSASFATDATALLFGEILALQDRDVVLLAGALVVTVGVAAAFHRAFVVAAFDARIAHTLGLRPGAAQVALVSLVTVAVVASYQAVGTLLVVGLLLGPVVAANRWTRRIPMTMVLASVLGALSVLVGLLVSWYAATAAGASIACTAVLLATLSALLRGLVDAWRDRAVDALDMTVDHASPAVPQRGTP